MTWLIGQATLMLWISLHLTLSVFSVLEQYIKKSTVIILKIYCTGDGLNPKHETRLQSSMLLMVLPRAWIFISDFFSKWFDSLIWFFLSFNFFHFFLSVIKMSKIYSCKNLGCRIIFKCPIQCAKYETKCFKPALIRKNRKYIYKLILNSLVLNVTVSLSVKCTETWRKVF